MKTTVLLTLLLSATAFAANGKTVSYKSGDETVHGVLFSPKGKGPFPALVVIHEYWGLVPWVKEQAAKLSDQGYVTLAVDLYRGKATDSPEVAHELMRGLPEDRANRDLLAAVQYLKTLKNVNPAKIGSIGWCMGGGYSLDLAIAEPTLAADVINYGHLATDPSRLQQIHAPILGLFGAQDKGIPPADVQKFEQDLKQMGKKIDATIYPDAGHAFENPNNKAGYRPADAADAWNRTVEFLAANLKK
ncbi:MAG TPA: dienelactone hydrolase family protein [Terriglobales bacterium]|nr:dienelactone hydrolase family protein [Terriglobales bacterium]